MKVDPNFGHIFVGRDIVLVSGFITKIPCIKDHVRVNHTHVYLPECLCLSFDATPVAGSVITLVTKWWPLRLTEQKLIAVCCTN